MIERDKVILEKAKNILMGNIYESDKYPWGKYRMIAPSRNGGFGIGTVHFMQSE